MGEEANGFIHDDDDFFTSSPLIEKHGKMTATVIGEKIYVIAESNDEGGQITVNILCKKDKKWSSPTILGTGPTSSKGHSAVLLNHERILILKHEASLDDCIWLLEVDTSSVNEQRKLLGTEVVAWSQGVVGDNLMPVVITGPSGVGKGTLISKLMEQFPSTFGFSVSHTTRRPREKETDGIHYHFTDRSIMEKDISDGKFLETASVHGNLYGTSLEAVERVASSGKRCILDIDVQGAKSVRASSLEAVFIFITPPSFEELEKRLRSRGTETEEQIQKRLRNAKSELEQGKCPGLFDHVLVNDDLGKCYETLKRILGLYGAEIMQLQRSKFPVCHSTRKAGQKWLLQCRSGESTKDFSTSFVLDASSVNGGFPGRTRDIYLSKADSLEFLKVESNGL